MQIQCTDDFSDREGGRRSPCVKPAPFQMQIQCTCDHHRAAAAATVGDRPLARPAASTAGASRKKNPARPSAPTRHTRQRIKPSLCRLGIQSEQTSETNHAARSVERGSIGLDPVAEQRHLIFTKKNSRSRHPRAREEEQPIRLTGGVNPSARRGDGQPSASTP